MSPETATFQAVYSKLNGEVLNGKPTEYTHQQLLTLPLSVIGEAPEVFQPRMLGSDTAIKEQHIRTLQNAIYNEVGNRLDPITVWWSGCSWYVLDGHHRLAAYREVKKQKKITIDTVPVRVFVGSLLKAMAEATRLNAKDKLAMTPEDKANRAWLFVAMQERLSKKDIASLCKISTATVGRMRKQLGLILEAMESDPELELEPLSMTWDDAQRFTLEPKDFDEEWELKLATEWAKRLGKTLGAKPVSQPLVFAQAIELYSPSLLQALAEYLVRSYQGDPWEDDNSDF